MVYFVDVFVKRVVVKCVVELVVLGVFYSEDDGDLLSYFLERREGNVMFDVEVGGDGVEELDLGEFGGEVVDEDDEGIILLFFEGGYFLGLKFVFLEVGDVVGDYEGDVVVEIDGFVKNEVYDVSCEDIVLYVKVLCLLRFV